MNNNIINEDDTRDNKVDLVIQRCADINNPKSFFLFAGAGSGKTKSLVDALENLEKNFGITFKEKQKQVAIITFTNKACDEINRRVNYNSLFAISTIHSFAWSLIKYYTNDIKDWLFYNLKQKCSILEEKVKKGNKKTKIYSERLEKIEKYNIRINNLPHVKKFQYSPEGKNIGIDYLSHSEVIKCCAYLLNKKKLETILVGKFPILFVDESQDTSSDLIDAFLNVQNNNSDCFCLGLFGDIMQEIYSTGKKDLSKSIPEDWERPQKIMNHRSFSRIVDLCNSIRFDTDGIQQQPREDHTGGFVRFFIVEKSKSPLWVAKKVSEIMSSTTNDLLWNDLKNVKNLILEHHMVCNNLNFEDFFMPLYVNKELKGDLPKGQIPFVVYFIKVIVKLYIANTNQNEFDFFNVIKKYSNYYKEKLKKLEFNKEILDKINKKMEPVRLIFAKDEFTCWEILIAINEAHLFTLSDDLTDVINWSNLNTFAKEYDENLNKNNSIYLSLQAPFREFISYFEYISGHSSFDTHQGVKGLEFDRVIVSINDDEANGFSFNYNNMFEGFSSNNLQVSKNENTKKLFYVTCSRAKESLAIVYYVEDINKSKAIIEKSKLVVEKEIIQL